MVCFYWVICLLLTRKIRSTAANFLYNGLQNEHYTVKTEAFYANTNSVHNTLQFFVKELGLAGCHRECEAKKGLSKEGEKRKRIG